MAEKYNPVPDLALLLDAALRAGWSALPYVDRLTEGLGLGPSGGPEAAEKLLRDALGLVANEACELESTRRGPCANLAAVRLTGTCEHGHAAERWVCGLHREPTEPLWCRTCYRLSVGAHECPVALLPAEAAHAAGTEAVYKTEGKDGFDPEADYYPIGEWPSYDEALEAARDSLAELDLSQPGAGGQSGIQDRVYVVHPDGRRERVFS